MARCRNFILLILACTATLAAYAQLAGVETKEAQVRALLSHEKLVPGLQFRVAVVVELAGHWHVNANPTTLPELIPTTLTLRSPDSVVSERIIYPKGQATQVGWADEPVALYSGRAIIFAEGRVRDNALPGPVTIEGELRYQACDDQVCLAPKTIPVRIETEIAEATVTPLPVHPEIFAAVPLPVRPGPAGEKNLVESLIDKGGWALAWVGIFLGGLALNLTPCVYPMIAITVSYFGGQGEKKIGSAFSHALVYCLGIVLTYSTLGLVAALTGGLFGALLQSPAVLIGIAVVLVALAMSMFGLYELQPPAFLMQKAAGLSSKAGYAGVFLLGATVGIIAAPCLGPFLLAVLVFVAQRGDPLMGWWMFFVLACGLGLPYVVLGTFSGLLARLPKSGTWMVWVKRVFGVALIAVAIWFVYPLIGSRSVAPSAIDWKPYSPELVANARRPVLIDFYADWCIPCHEMDKRTFTDPRAIEESKKFLMLKVDLTKTGSPEVQKLIGEFKIIGFPTFVFIAPGGSERADLRQVGFVPADQFLPVMQQAAGAHN